MRIYLLLLTGILLSLPLLAQQQLQGRVIANTDQANITEANIFVFELAGGTITDENGRFILNNLPDKFTIRVSHIGFSDKIMIFDQPVDTFLTIRLDPAINELQQIVVTPYKTPTPISSTKKKSIRDFDVTDNHIFALEYFGGFKKQQLSVRGLDGQTIQSIELTKLKNIRALHTGCNDDVYLINRDYAYPIKYDKQELIVGNKISKGEFDNYIEPCKVIDTVTIYYLFSSANGLKQTIRTFDVRTESVETLREISDQKKVNAFYADYGYNQVHQNSHNMGDINSEENKRIRRNQTTSDFLLQVLYKPKLPVHLFDHNEEIVVFNHPEQKIECYYYDNLARTIPIDYPLLDSWLKEVIQDPITQQFYALFSYGDDTVVKKIDIRTGETIPVAYLKERAILVQKVRVLDDVLYYTIRDQERTGNKGLKKINL